MLNRIQNFTGNIREKVKDNVENIREKVKDNMNKIKHTHLFNSKFGSNPFAEEDITANMETHEQTANSADDLDDDFVILSTETALQSWKYCLRYNLKIL